MNAKLLYFKLFALIVLSLGSYYCAAQEQADTLSYYVQTTDGNTYRGQIISQDSLSTLFNIDRLGEIRFPKTTSFKQRVSPYSLGINNRSESYAYEE